LVRKPLDFLLPIRRFPQKNGAARKNQPSSIAISTKEVMMSLRKNERCPIHNSFFCCRW
jgi:hypothetical protein